MAATLLELDLTTPLLEVPRNDPVSLALGRRRPLLRDILDGLRDAAIDPDVAGLVAHVGWHGRGPTLAQVQEIRDAVRRFRAAGKPAVAWAETFGEFGPGTLPYYLASAFGEIWLQPSGDLGFTGVVAQAVFVREALDKLGVTPQLSQRHEYKTAAETFSAPGMSAAHREAAGRLASSAMAQVLTDVADGRALQPDRVRELRDQAPLTAEQARDAGLVDRVGYRDQVYADLRRRLGEVQPRYLHRYARARARQPQRALLRLARRPVVAVLHAAGDIHLGRGGRRPLGAVSIGAESLGNQLRALARDVNVRAVVLRIDSGGGSYVASDAIRREVLRLRESGRPVVVSMGTVAASGGYFIAMAADTVLAAPGTLTGSIGVLGGKAVVRDLLQRLGIARDSVAEGRNAEMFSTYRAFSDDQWRRVEDWLDRVYDDFTAKVAADRGLTREHVEAVARGRVWTGGDALGHRLVDELGGRERAVEVACARVGFTRADVEVRSYPHLGPWDRLRPAESSDDRRAAAYAGERGPLALLAGALGLPAAAGVLTAPVLWELT